MGQKQITVNFAPKSHSPLFTSDIHQFYINPGILFEGDLLSVQRHHKILGVDIYFTIALHINYITERCTSRLRILKALAGDRWGHYKETLLVTYRAFIHSIMLYAGLVWYPNASNSAMGRLQRLQNAGLRITSGSLRIASICHLHRE